MARTDNVVLINDQREQFKTRLPEDLHTRLKDAARVNGRSTNAEIVARLEASFEPARELSPAIAKAVEEYVNAEVARRLREIASKLGDA